MRFKTMSVVLVGLLAACSSDSGDGQNPGGSSLSSPQPKEIGEACAANDECETGTCAPAGICTRPCDMHSDCGCPINTTNGDILNGLCHFACMESTCTTTCNSNVDCAGQTDCTSGQVFNACL